VNETEEFLRKHRGKGAFLDANLLLVYAVGRWDRRLLGTFHHTKQFEGDFEWIERLVLRWFAKIYTTPNVLTEVSNLGGKLGNSFFDELKTVVAQLVETHCPSVTGTQDKKFREVGLTDSIILAVGAANPSVVLTADFDLYCILRARQIDAININYLRQAHWAMGSRQLR
jgi:hypothetical protein